MPMTRRQLLTTALASALLPGGPAFALSDGPFLVSEAEVDKVPYKYRRREVEYKTKEPAGTIVVDAAKRYLYLVRGSGQATRYGVSVGKGSKSWTGEAVVRRMAKWPVWVPTPDHLTRNASLAKWVNGMPGGPENPMGARALYLYQGDVDTTYRIHGGTKPAEIGKKVTAGCFGLINIDAIHLYDQIAIGTRVVVLKSWFG
jgi:lipoprotein-anchoring transpeptidase ErfK/SrfK